MTNDNEQRGGTVDGQRLGRLAYSVTEAAAVTGLGKTTLYALMGDGTLPSCKVGKRRLITSADLADLISGRPEAAYRRTA